MSSSPEEEVSRPCNLHNSRVVGIVLLLTGISFIIAGFFTSGYLTRLFYRTIDSATIISSEKSAGFEAWRTNTQQKENEIPVLKKIWLYNVTNPNEFLHLGEKLNVQEIGPFVYQQFFEHYDISFYDGKLSYKTHTWFTFVSKPDAVTMDMNITVVNLPAQLVAGPLLKKGSSGQFIFNMVDTLGGNLLSQLFVTLSLESALFGYNSTIFDSINQITKAFNIKPPTVVPVHYGGFMANQTTRDPNALNDVVWTGETDSAITQNWYKFQDYTTVQLCFAPPCPPNPLNAPWNQADPQSNVVEGSSGKQFHHEVSASEDLLFFNPFAFRTCKLKYTSTVHKHDISLLEFQVDDSIFQNASTVPSNAAYYNFGRSGVINLTAVLNGAPFFISKPYFLDADPSFLTDFTGMPANGNPLLHNSFFDVEPYSGTVLGAQVRIQGNILLQPFVFPSKTYFNFTPVVVPMFWFEQGGEITDSLGREVAGGIVLALNTIKYSLITGIALGVTLLALGGYITYRAYVFRSSIGLPFFHWAHLPEDPEAVKLTAERNEKQNGEDIDITPQYQNQ